MQVQRTTEIDMVHCSGCGFTSPELSLTRCECGKVLGEIVVTCRRRSRLAAVARFVALWAVSTAVLAAIYTAASGIIEMAAR